MKNLIKFLSIIIILSSCNMNSGTKNFYYGELKANLKKNNIKLGFNFYKSKKYKNSNKYNKLSKLEKLSVIDNEFNKNNIHDYRKSFSQYNEKIYSGNELINKSKLKFDQKPMYYHIKKEFKKITGNDIKFNSNSDFKYNSDYIYNSIIERLKKYIYGLSDKKINNTEDLDDTEYNKLINEAPLFEANGRRGILQRIKAYYSYRGDNKIELLAFIELIAAEMGDIEKLIPKVNKIKYILDFQKDLDYTKYQTKEEKINCKLFKFVCDINDIFEFCNKNYEKVIEEAKAKIFEYEKSKLIKYPKVDKTKKKKTFKERKGSFINFFFTPPKEGITLKTRGVFGKLRIF